MLTRRFFLTAGAGSLVAAGLPFSVAATSASNRRMAIAIDQTLGSSCKVYAGDQIVAQLDLVGVDQPFPAETRVAQYIFNFASAAPVFLPEAGYRVIHPALGELDLLLQPCGHFNGDQHDGLQYRACITMLRQV